MLLDTWPYGVEDLTDPPVKRLEMTLVEDQSIRSWTDRVHGEGPLHQYTQFIWSWLIFN